MKISKFLSGNAEYCDVKYDFFLLLRNQVRMFDVLRHFCLHIPYSCSENLLKVWSTCCSKIRYFGETTQLQLLFSWTQLLFRLLGTVVQAVGPNSFLVCWIQQLFRLLDPTVVKAVRPNCNCCSAGPYCCSDCGTQLFFRWTQLLFRLLDQMLFRHSLRRILLFLGLEEDPGRISCSLRFQKGQKAPHATTHGAKLHVTVNG